MGAAAITRVSTIRNVQNYWVAVGRWLTAGTSPPAPQELTLATNPKALNQSFVSFRTLPFQVVQQSPAPRHHDQQSPAGVMIFLVGLEVLGKLLDPMAQDGNLHFRRAAVIVVQLVLGNYF